MFCFCYIAVLRESVGDSDTSTDSFKPKASPTLSDASRTTTNWRQNTSWQPKCTTLREDCKREKPSARRTNHNTQRLQERPKRDERRTVGLGCKVWGRYCLC